MLRYSRGAAAAHQSACAQQDQRCGGGFGVFLANVTVAVLEIHTVLLMAVPSASKPVRVCPSSGPPSKANHPG